MVAFPLYMALNKDNLLISGSSQDGHYSNGQIFSIDTNRLDDLLKTDNSPENLKKSIISYKLISPEPGPFLWLFEKIFFLSKSLNQAFTFSLNEKRIENLKPLEKLTLNDSDPISFSVLKNDRSPIMALSYLSFDELSLLNYENDEMVFKKNLSLKKIINTSLKKPITKKQTVILKKIFNTSLQTFLALEKKRFPLKSKHQPKGAFLSQIKTADLLTLEKEEDAKINTLDLRELFSIYEISDFYIDEKNSIAYILSNSPSAIYKIDIVNQKLIESINICSQATNFDVNLGLEKIVIPCFYNNIIISVNSNTFTIDKFSDNLGRNPGMALIDENKQKIYVSIFNDWTVAILDFDLKILGYIFEKIPKNI